MNNDALHKVLTKYFNIVQFNEDLCVIKCEKHYKDKTYEIFYFDISENFLAKDFSIENYQNSILKDDYYLNPGYLQWNFYLVFLYDSDELPIDRIEIEKDEEYARKFIIPFNDIDKWLKSRYDVTINENFSLNIADLSIVWIELLKQNNLDCVYLENISYDRGFNSFLMGEPIKDTQDTSDSTDLSNKNTPSTIIEGIYFDLYRRYPLNKEFTFGRFNLIIGENGTGKTSLLEAIELAICGKNYRNPAYKNVNTKINVKYKGWPSYDSIDLDNNYLYRYRDYTWYNNQYSKGNNLYISFNRFNYYNSDAALELSNEKGKSEEILNAFQDIALGPNVNYIDDRLTKYLKMFSTEKNRCQKDLSNYVDLLNYEEQTMQDLKSKNNHVSMLNNFINELNTLKWKNFLLLGVGYEYNAYERDHLIVKNNLNTIIKNIYWLEDLTLRAIYIEHDKLNKEKNEYERISSELNHIDRESHIFSNTIAVLKANLTLLQSYKKYLSFDLSNNLIGLNDRIGTLQKNISRGKEIVNLYHDLSETRSDFLSIFNDYTIAEIDTKLNSKIFDIGNREGYIKDKIGIISKDISTYDELITDIKVKGSELVSKFSNINTCPLCNRNLTPGELESTLLQKHEQSDKLIEREKLLIEYNNLLTLKIEINNHMNTLKQLKPLNLRLDSININELKLSRIMSIFKNEEEKYNKNIETLSDLQSLKDHLALNNYTEEEYNLILINIKRDSKYDHIDVQNIDNEIQRHFRDIEYYESNLRVSAEKWNNQNEKLKILELSYADKSYHIKIDTYINSRISILKDSLNLLNEVSTILELSPAQSIKELNKQVELSYSMFEEYREEKKLSDRVDISMKKSVNKINEYTNKIREITNKLEIVNQGYEALSNIVNNYSKEKVLSNFIEENKKDILDIFMQIHSPKEFYGIDFNENRIILKRTGSDDDAELSTISTGQRSALALSIFLSLNKKLQKGPLCVMFDDPIAYVDDLNILSFIDYLREIVLCTNRQIFFASANENLAFLIQQKFAFLDNSDIKIFKLTR